MWRIQALGAALGIAFEAQLVGTDWVVTTIPGTAGQGGLPNQFGHDSPFGVTVDLAGTLYIADYGNSGSPKPRHRRYCASPALKSSVTMCKLISSPPPLIPPTCSNFKAPPMSSRHRLMRCIATRHHHPGGAYGYFRAVTARNGVRRFYRIKM